SQTNSRSRPDSPLAKIYGYGAPPPRRGKEVNLDAKDKAEVEGLKEEMKEVRASQLRMEEMLSKMIAGK
ncbi:hypothetical protein ACEN88_35635, partial [Massilia sp. CT11-108]|uniref:hypothetical protein n=1 Tax=Massilia sp. CT11-108 TaxID=3393900 RepID=UPI0039A51024